MIYNMEWPTREEALEAKVYRNTYVSLIENFSLLLKILSPPNKCGSFHH